MAVDIERRLEAAAGVPDSDAALNDVLGRIRRRTRRRAAAAGMTAVLALVVGVMAFTARDRDDGDTVRTAGEAVDRSLVVRQQWRTEPLGEPVGEILGAGRFVVDAGNGAVVSAVGGHVTAIDRDSGSVLWDFQRTETLFLQGATASVVVVTTQQDSLFGLDARDGTVRWTLSLAEEGLAGYGAVTGAVTDPVSAIGLSASTEGDVRPPVVLGIDTTSGAVAWTTPLADGTDLTWGTPVPDDGVVAFHATLSHPESAPGNSVHVVRLGDGSIEATYGLGGSQGFTSDPVIVDGSLVYVPAWPEVQTFDRAGDRTQRHSINGRGALVADGRLWVLAPEFRLVAVDATTGSPLVDAEMLVNDAQRLVDLGDGLIGVITPAEIAVFDSRGNEVARKLWPAPAADVVIDIDDRGRVDAVLVDGTVAAYRVEGADVATGAVFDEQLRYVYTAGNDTWAVLESGQRASLEGVGTYPSLAGDGRTILYSDGDFPSTVTIALDTSTGRRRVVDGLGEGTYYSLAAEVSIRGERAVAPVASADGAMSIAILSPTTFELERDIPLGPESKGAVSLAWDSDGRHLLAFTWDTESAWAWFWIDVERGTANLLDVPEHLNPTQHQSFFLGSATSSGVFPALLEGGWGELRIANGRGSFTVTEPPGPSSLGNATISGFWDADDGRYVTYWEQYTEHSGRLLRVAPDGTTEILLEGVDWIDGP